FAGDVTVVLTNGQDIVKSMMVTARDERAVVTTIRGRTDKDGRSLIVRAAGNVSDVSTYLLIPANLLAKLKIDDLKAQLSDTNSSFKCTNATILPSGNGIADVRCGDIEVDTGFFAN